MEDYLRKFSPIVSLNDSVYSVSPRILTTLHEHLKEGKPFAYLLSQVEFCEHRFYVNEHVLIPRPETELMTELILKEPKVHSVVDVGSGSGAILLTLLKSKWADSGIGVDLSNEALDVARINSRRLRIRNVQWRISDRLESVPEVVDAVVTNPPYIKASAHRDLVHQSVDRHEPKLALYLEDKIYESWFADFFMSVKVHLKPGGLLMMEGHECELASQAKMLSELGYTKVEVLQDYTNRDRFLRARVN